MKEDTTPIDPTWMEKTGGFAKDMTMRDYLAAKAMQGLVERNKNLDCTPYEAQFTSTSAYQMADAMLKAREQ